MFDISSIKKYIHIFLFFSKSSFYIKKVYFNKYPQIFFYKYKIKINLNEYFQTSKKTLYKPQQIHICNFT